MTGLGATAGVAGEAPATIVVSHRARLAVLYPDELDSIADYVRLVPRLQAAMGPHDADLLRAGLSVVHDSPTNTRVSRTWMRSIFEADNSALRPHVLDVPDEVSLARLFTVRREMIWDTRS